MPTSRVLVCFCAVACAPLLNAQTPPSAYVITQSVGTTGGTSIIYRSGSKVLVDFTQPAQAGTPASRSLSLYDLTAGTSTTWDPTASPIQCSAGTFSGDWGDPFAMTADSHQGHCQRRHQTRGHRDYQRYRNPDLYRHFTAGNGIKVWLDQKHGLVIRAQTCAPNNCSDRCWSTSPKSPLPRRPRRSSFCLLPAQGSSRRPPRLSS